MATSVSHSIHFFSFVSPDPRVSVRGHCFPIRVILLWNRLPASVILAESIQLFKKLLRQVVFLRNARKGLILVSVI